MRLPNLSSTVARPSIYTPIQSISTGSSFFQTAPGRLGFSCSRSVCSCTGDADCNDMFTTNVCGKNAICIDNICICWR